MVMSELNYSSMEYLYTNVSRHINELRDSDQLSLSNDIAVILTKLVIVDGSSIFENYIKTCIFSIAENKKAQNLIEMLMEKKFWSMFDSKFKSLNRFLKHFGSEFSEEFINSVKDNEELSDSERNFLRLLQLRGDLVHNNNSLSYSIPVTHEEAHNTFTRSILIVKYLAENLCKKL